MFALLLKLSTDFKAGNYSAAFQDFIALLQLMAKNPPSAAGMYMGRTVLTPFSSPAEATLYMEGMMAHHGYSVGAEEVPVGKINWQSFFDFVTKFLPFILPFLKPGA